MDIKVIVVIVVVADSDDMYVPGSNILIFNHLAFYIGYTLLSEHYGHQGYCCYCCCCRLG